MRKTRIHDLAAEFGIDSGQLLKMLSDMDIHVRSHMSGLDSDQVALVRARWEREKRRASAPKAKTAKRGRRRAAATETTEPVAQHPRRRRRTAAQVAAKAAEEAEAEKPIAVEPEPLVEIPMTITFTEPEVAAEPQIEPAAVSEQDQLPAEAAGTIDAQAETPASSVETKVPADPEAASYQRVEPVIPRRVQRAPVSRSRPRSVPASPRPVASAAPGEVAEERKRDRKKRRRGKRTQVDRDAVQANISRTLASIQGPVGKRSPRRRDGLGTARELEEERRTEEKERERTTVRVNEFITVAELAGMLDAPATEIVAFCFKELSMMVTVNQRLDFDQIDLIAGAFGFNAVREEGYTSETEIAVAQVEDEDDLEPRPPVVTVMGHVDHGKTSLLDYIRKANVTKGEEGGITQHIGAYHFEISPGKVITFLDTPGHEAFTAMRARGAQITDLVVLVVAADDQVMPQTVEAISHAKNAGVPIVVAINKVDLPSADSDKVKQDLLKHDVTLEDFGGETLCSAISAKTGQGVDELLEKILLQAELLDNQANPNRSAAGIVVESTLDPGKGPVATILVKSGTLKVGDHFVCGSQASRVRAMLDEHGARVKSAGPSIPVQVLGFTGVPQAGDSLVVMATAEEVREIAQRRQRLDREADHRRTSRAVSLEQLAKRIEEGKVQHLNIIIKADQGGPAEALADAFARLSTDEVRVAVVHRGVGAINESDVIFAKAADAVIIGFHVRPDRNARVAAEREKVDVRTYRVIYDAVEDVRQALEGMLAPEERETILGEAEVRQIFKVSGVGTIAGCYVQQGIIRRGARVRVVRDGVEIYDGALNSLRRFKDDAREVREGLECGMGIENFNDIKIGDIFEPYEVTQVARTLEAVGAEKGN